MFCLSLSLNFSHFPQISYPFNFPFPISLLHSNSMASSLSTTASVVIQAVNPSLNPHNCNVSLRNVSFCPSSRARVRFFAKNLQPRLNCSTVVKAQVNEASLDGSAAATTPNKSEVPSPEAIKPPKESSATLATEESISEFISQVTSLVKLVDSRDIVELQMKQLDCELIIRKKEAMPQPPSPAPVMMMHSPSPSAMPPAPLAPPVSSPALSPAPSLLPPPRAAKSAKSSIPPLKCPMAGTFYRCPGPGEPPFVKVGDKVQKGQVICIIEAMKLMNEIEADQSGTVVEILVEDGKSVSVDMPLFMIQP